MHQTHHETHVTNDEFYQPGTGQEASTARLPGEIIPTALVGPAQQGESRARSSCHVSPLGCQ